MPKEYTIGMSGPPPNCYPFEQYFRPNWRTLNDFHRPQNVPPNWVMAVQRGLQWNQQLAMQQHQQSYNPCFRHPGYSPDPRQFYPAPEYYWPSWPCGPGHPIPYPNPNCLPIQNGPQLQAICNAPMDVSNSQQQDTTESVLIPLTNSGIRTVDNAPPTIAVTDQDDSDPIADIMAAAGLSPGTQNEATTEVSMDTETDESLLPEVLAVEATPMVSCNTPVSVEVNFHKNGPMTHFDCVICGKKFRQTRRPYMRHMRYHLGEILLGHERPHPIITAFYFKHSLTSSARERFPLCRICDTVCINRQSMRKHVSCMHRAGTEMDFCFPFWSEEQKRKYGLDTGTCLSLLKATQNVSVEVIDARSSASTSTISSNRSEFDTDLNDLRNIEEGFFKIETDQRSRSNSPDRLVIDVPGSPEPVNEEAEESNASNEGSVQNVENEIEESNIPEQSNIQNVDNSALVIPEEEHNYPSSKDFENANSPCQNTLSTVKVNSTYWPLNDLLDQKPTITYPPQSDEGNTETSITPSCQAPNENQEQQPCRDPPKTNSPDVGDAGDLLEDIDQSFMDHDYTQSYLSQEDQTTNADIFDHTNDLDSSSATSSHSARMPELEQISPTGDNSGHTPVLNSAHLSEHDYCSLNLNGDMATHEPSNVNSAQNVATASSNSTILNGEQSESNSLIQGSFTEEKSGPCPSPELIPCSPSNWPINDNGNVAVTHKESDQTSSRGPKSLRSNALLICTDNLDEELEQSLAELTARSKRKLDFMTRLIKFPQPMSKEVKR